MYFTNVLTVRTETLFIILILKMYFKTFKIDI